MNHIPGRTVTRLRSDPGGFDDDGDPVASTVDEVDICDCLVYPRTEGGEPTERGRNGVVVGLWLLAPIGTDLVHTDRIRVDGVVWNVDGDVGAWPDPFGAGVGGIVAALERAVG